jgi:putative methionine-R-sulfoxide reductase with GAF domain
VKFLRSISLKQFSAGLLALLLVVTSVEFLLIRQHLKALEAVEQQADYVRHAQVKSQQLTLLLQRFINGESQLNPIISSEIDQYDHIIKTVATGGRVDGTENFIKPLSRLPKITFDNLQESWNNYKQSALAVVTEPEQVTVEIKKDSTVVMDTVANDSTVRDALPAPVTIPNPALAKAKMLIAGKWLTFSSWHDKLVVDLQEEELQNEARLNIYFVLMVLFNIGLLIYLYVLFNNYVLKPLHNLESNTSGKIHTADLPANEIGTLAAHINNTLEELKDATDFVEKIGEGNLEIKYQDLDATFAQGKNKLADSLVSMQAKLKTLNEEEQKRQWSNEGLAKFVDILRSSNDNIHELGDNIIAALVQYTHSNQGGLYILNDENENTKHLELISLFAFEHKKFDKKKIKLGEGILGQAFLERETTYLTDIPEDYVRITSGLGESSPKAILIVPLKVDQDVYGIVELASFKKYKPHEIAFVEKLGETIASTLASVKSAQRNRHLIEQFQQQTEEMRAQEEEMRQNMEELQATQEEIARKERGYIERIQELESQTTSTHADHDAIQLKDELAKKERDYQTRIKELEAKLNQKPVRADDWALAEEVEKTLRVNLEALKITQQELERKTEKN